MQVPVAGPSCITSGKINISGGLPGFGSMQYEWKKEDCGNPNFKNDSSKIDAIQILNEISSFFKQFLSRRWQSSSINDFPLLIIKTYLQ
ncbi:unnamed protein product [Rotaria sp. Silwood1]|nr:unnamed protein product [Rotaria sp. Silwood1]